jgi:LssY C-terminus
MDAGEIGLDAGWMDGQFDPAGSGGTPPSTETSPAPDFGRRGRAGQAQGRTTLRRVIHDSGATVLLWVKRITLLVVVLLTGWAVYEYLILQIVEDRDPIGAFLALWLLSAYVFLPRLQRVLTKIYVPDYFVGRARTSEGLLGDPVNLAVLGTEDDLVRTMLAGGWTRADDLSFKSGLRLVRCTLLQRRYPAAPVSPLFLFGRRQDLAFEQEIVGKPSRRHHVRFWKCPDGWYMPGGLRVDWVAAGTYDRSVGFSVFTLQITHKIGEDTDLERDHILRTMEQAGGVTSVHWVQDYFSGYHARNGGGDAISTDGNLPVVRVREPMGPLAG